MPAHAHDSQEVTMVAGLKGHRLGSCNIDNAMPVQVHAHIDGTPYQHARPLHEHELRHMEDKWQISLPSEP